MSAGKFMTFDVMLRGRFVRTLRLPLYMADDHKDGKFIVSQDTLVRFVEQKLPTLKGKPYNICF